MLSGSGSQPALSLPHAAKIVIVIITAISNATKRECFLFILFSFISLFYINTPCVYDFNYVTH
jgi:hypothetical protein